MSSPRHDRNSQVEYSTTASIGVPPRSSAQGPGLESAGFAWEPQFTVVPPARNGDAATATPANEVLIRLARNPAHQPPPSWWEDENPFSPDDR
ncbi:MAG: hypothetical protein FLDDKLPJ_03505 [Phycisphaerae bacterium]|nr:hypothetical protein [Phycisphaerae bacterium]